MSTLEQRMNEIATVSDEWRVRAKELETILGKLTVGCPFDGPHGFAPEDPCPICGDLGTLGPVYEEPRQSRCLSLVRKMA